MEIDSRIIFLVIVFFPEALLLFVIFLGYTIVRLKRSGIKGFPGMMAILRDFSAPIPAGYLENEGPE